MVISFISPSEKIHPRSINLIWFFLLFALMLNYNNILCCIWLFAISTESKNPLLIVGSINFWVHTFPLGTDLIAIIGDIKETCSKNGKIVSVRVLYTMSKHVSDSSKCSWSETSLIHINNQMHISSCLPKCVLYTWPKRQQTLEQPFLCYSERGSVLPQLCLLQVDFMCQDLECTNTALNSLTGALTHVVPLGFGLCVSSALNL